MKRLFIISLLIILHGYSYSQTIDFGEDAYTVKRLVELTTQSRNATDSHGNRLSSYTYYDVQYENGKIVDVVQCYQDQYIVDFDIVANFCRHYLMGNRLVNHVLEET